MKIGIVGSRSFSDYELLCESINSFLTSNQVSVEAVVSGGARGADLLAERFARDNGLKIIVHRALWNTFGKSAGIIRNEAIVKDSDIIFAFWDGKSSGTKNTIERVKKSGKRVFIVAFNTESV